MSLKLFVHGLEVDVLFSRFPAGESLVRIIDDPANYPNNRRINIRVVLNFESNDDLFNLGLLVDAVNRLYKPYLYINLWLDMPYLPYARQDRVCNPGESLSVKVVADFINTLNFNYVWCSDIHSEVGKALINNLQERELGFDAGCFLHQFDRENTTLVAPDAGASKKVFAFAKKYAYSQVIVAEKKRNTLTGEIEGITINSTFGRAPKDFLILDDICDGGRTFIELAKELRKLTTGNIYLYVTHGIFSKGYEVFEGVLDGIYVSNLMNKNTHELIKEV